MNWHIQKISGRFDVFNTTKSVQTQCPLMAEIVLELLEERYPDRIDSVVTKKGIVPNDWEYPEWDDLDESDPVRSWHEHVSFELQDMWPKLEPEVKLALARQAYAVAAATA